MRGTSATCFAVALVVAACKPHSPQPQVVAPPRPDARPPSPCPLLRDRLCAQFGQSSDVCGMAGEQTRAFIPERCTAMLARYEATAAAAVRYVAGKAALSARAQDTPHGPAPSLGRPDAPLTLVIFSDFDDDGCGRGSSVATAIKNLYADRVRLVFRQFPLATHANAHLAAEASLAAHAQGKFWAYHDMLFGNPQDHSRAALERYAKEAHLDLAKFRKALDQKSFAADVDADSELGRKVNIGGVPAMFANGRPVRFPYGTDELAGLVEKPVSP